MNKRMLVLENGLVYHGEGFGSAKPQVAEIVFNTSMVGYQEIISDPSNYAKIVLMSYPLIGNYGLTEEDYESKSIQISGLVVREYNDYPSNFRFTKTLGEVMDEAEVAGISGIDTRELVGVIRDEGSMKAVIAPESFPIEECLKMIKEYMPDKAAAKSVTCQKIWYAKTRNPIFNVLAIDLGINISTVKKLNSYGCNVIVAPLDTPLKVIENFKPDGLFISNGPGCACALDEVITLLNQIKGKIPIAGVGLGATAIAISYGATLTKMKNGHMGANLPVKYLQNDKIDITVQNHTYSIDKESLKNTELKITHVNILDGDIEGILDDKNMVIGMQYEPNILPYTEENGNLYSVFTAFMQNEGGNKNGEKNRY